jgi:hypothetical protein
VRLELDREAAVIGGGTVARSLPVWLRVSPVAAFPSRRWVRVRYRSSFFDDVARPLIRFETADGVEPMTVGQLGPFDSLSGWSMETRMRSRETARFIRRCSNRIGARSFNVEHPILAGLHVCAAAISSGRDAAMSAISYQTKRGRLIEFSRCLGGNR